MAASPMFVMAGGTVQGLIVVIAIVLALRGYARAPELAMFAGLGSGPRINVTWFSWATALAEIGTGLLFAYAGLRARRERDLA